MKLYLRMLGYLRPHLGLFALSVVAMALFAALDAFSFTLLIPFLDVLFADAGRPGGMMAEGDSPIHRALNWLLGDAVAGVEPMTALRNVVLVMFLIFLLKNIASYVQHFTGKIIEGRLTRDFRNDIYDRLLGLGFGFFQRTRSGQLISRTTVDVDKVRELVVANLARALSAAMQVVVFVVVLFLLSWELTLVALLFVPPMILLWERLRKRLHAGVHQVLDAVGELSAQIQETVGGIRLVKASAAEPWEKRRFRNLTNRHYEALVRNEAWRQFFPPATEMIIAIAVLTILWFGAWLVLAEAALTAPAFIAFLAVAMRLMSPMKFLGHFPALVQPGVAAAERALELIDAEPEVVEPPDARPLDGFDRALSFEGVSFRYGTDVPVLHEIDLEVRAGEVVALVGPSGAGKSTMADLVPRFYDPTEGRIRIDGHDLREVRLADLRGMLGIVAQETILFHDTVRANIAYARPEATDEDVSHAARMAHADGFIRALPEGYDTMLGERGVRLSGGQRQRIAIARALLRNPPILILDEATSALDTESERAVQEAIEALMKGRTVLVIAHRLSTVRRADRIVVMEAGRIVDIGTHEELLKREGLYQRLYRMQFAEGDHLLVSETESGV